MARKASKLVHFIIVTTPEPDPTEKGIAFKIRKGYEPEAGIEMRVKVTKAGVRGEPGEYE